jgi:acetoin utilization protein AcuB
MRLVDIMSSPVATIESSESAEAATNLMQERGIHHLVVTDKGKAVGVLSARDLGGPRGVALRWAGTAGEIMSGHIYTAGPQTTVQEAANMLRGRAIGCLPVVDGERIVGIVTITDLLDVLARGGKPVSDRSDPPGTPAKARLSHGKRTARPSPRA